MELTIYQLDAFTDRLFGGNPAAVCPLEEWLSDGLMQQIAMENNLAETAFIVHERDGWRIRWFTPLKEVNLCGHATLAAAWVYFHHIEPGAHQVAFNSQSGQLGVEREGNRLTLDFPVADYHAQITPPLLVEALAITPQECFAADDWMVVVENESIVQSLQPDLRLLQQLDRRGVIVTAAGDDCDFVSRFFAPKYGIDEDPVTGSAHTLLSPYWSQRLNKSSLHARQLSPRGGELWCEIKGERVFISGHVVPYLKGVITL
ncbi:MAG: PhzF family phenazine biosynthesis protein [Chromatiales bacterium]|nr:PhzF family phenazine biosynthesis protein [Chromatiales bacterium]